MGLDRGAIEAMAPDQSALAAASGLIKPAKWPVRAQSGGLIWGECQGSGANPYRVMADTEDPGSKCTCPSRKFPCKHALALMWMFVEDAAAFRPAAVPDWVHEWMGRRRKGTGAPMAAGAAKSLDAARLAEAPKPVDADAEARRIAAANRRAADTRRSVRAATEDLDMWIADQLRTGLAGFVAEHGERCRRVAARLVDGKAAALAGRLDEMPARLLALPPDERAVLLTRAWRAQPDDPELRRDVIGAETRDDVLNDPAAPRVESVWEVLGERIATRRDGLVSVETWLLGLGGAARRFAVLLDFFPASAGRRGGAFTPGERFPAILAFYPARAPLRAVIAARGESLRSADPWPDAPAGHPLDAHAALLLDAPWRLETPMLLPAGRIARDAAGRAWWRADGDASVLPIAQSPPPLAFGATIARAAAVWNGARLSLIAAETDWGRMDFDG